MPATDIEQAVAEALKAILSAALSTLIPRTDHRVIPQDEIVKAQLPVLTYDIVTHTTAGGTGDNRNMTVTLSAFAEGDHAKATTRAIIEVCETALTVAAFAAQNVDAAVMGNRRRYPGPVDSQGTDRRKRSTVDIDIWATKH